MCVVVKKKKLVSVPSEDGANAEPFRIANKYIIPSILLYHCRDVSRTMDVGCGGFLSVLLEHLERLKLS